MCYTFEMPPVTTMFETPPTDHLFLATGPAAVGGGEGGGARLRVPRHVAVLRGTADGQRVDTVGVTVTVTVVSVATSVA